MMFKGSLLSGGDNEYNIKLSKEFRDFLSYNYSTFNSIGNMLLPSIVGFIPVVGKALSFTMMVLSGSGNATAGAMENGASGIQAYMYGILSGLSEATTQRILGGIPGVSKLGGSFLKNLLGEGLEEFVQTYFDAGLRAIILGEPIDLTNLIGESIQAGIQGILVSGIMQGGNALTFSIAGIPLKMTNSEFKSFAELLSNLDVKGDAAILNSIFKNTSEGKIQDVMIKILNNKLSNTSIDNSHLLNELDSIIFNKLIAVESSNLFSSILNTADANLKLELINKVVNNTTTDNIKTINLLLEKMEPRNLSDCISTLIINNETEILNEIMKSSNVRILSNAVMYMEPTKAGTCLRMYAELNSVKEILVDPFEVDTLKGQFLKYGIPYDITENAGKYTVNPISMVMLHISIDSYWQSTDIKLEDYTKLLEEGKIGGITSEDYLDMKKINANIAEELYKGRYNSMLGTEYYNNILSAKYANAIKKIDQMTTMFENGTYDSAYTISDVLYEQMMYKLSTETLVKDGPFIVPTTFKPRWGKKVINGIDGDVSYLFPSFDSLITDVGVVNFMNNITNKNITTIEGWIEELKNANPPYKLQGITFQDATPGKANFLKYNYHVGPNSQSTLTTSDSININTTGGAFTMVTTFKELAKRYGYCCNNDGDVFTITNYTQFGQDVLGGVNITNSNGVYVIEYNVDINSTNISAPSLYNSSSYADAFVPGGQNLSGLTEAVVSSINITTTIGNSSTVVPTDPVLGYNAPVVFKIDQIATVVPNPNPVPNQMTLYYFPNASGTDTLTIYKK